MFFSDLLSQNKDGQTKLFVASMNNKVEEVERILNVAAENNVVADLINKGTNKNNTPLWPLLKEAIVMFGFTLDRRDNIALGVIAVVAIGCLTVFFSTSNGHLELSISNFLYACGVVAVTFVLVFVALFCIFCCLMAYHMDNEPSEICNS